MPGGPRERVFPALAPSVTTPFRASLLQLPIFGDEHLNLYAVNLHTTVAAELECAGRIWSDADQQIRYFAQRLTVPPGGTAAPNLQLERGALLSCRFVVLNAEITLGDVFVTAAIIKGGLGAVVGYGELLQGYIGYLNALAWPGSAVVDSGSGRGRIRSLTWTILSPSQVYVTVPANRRWRVLGGCVRLITSAVIGDRGIFATAAAPSTNSVFAGESSPAQPASMTIIYALSPGVGPSTSAGRITQLLPWLPDLELLPGFRIQVNVNGILAGDVFEGFECFVREWYN
jgi:hypothetical protein